MANITYSIDSINELIQNSSFTKYELAQRIGVTPSHFYNVLNKKVPLSDKMAKKIISALTPAPEDTQEVYNVNVKKANVIIEIQRLADANGMSIKEMIDFILTQCFPPTDAPQHNKVVPKEVLDRFRKPTLNS